MRVDSECRTRCAAWRLVGVVRSMDDVLLLMVIHRGVLSCYAAINHLNALKLMVLMIPSILCAVCDGTISTRRLFDPRHQLATQSWHVVLKACNVYAL